MAAKGWRKNIPPGDRLAYLRARRRALVHRRKEEAKNYITRLISQLDWIHNRRKDTPQDDLWSTFESNKQRTERLG